MPRRHRRSPDADRHRDLGRHARKLGMRQLRLTGGRRKGGAIPERFHNRREAGRRALRATPRGIPWYARVLPSMGSAQPGTLDACSSTAALPAMRLGAAKRKACQNAIGGIDRSQRHSTPSIGSVSDGSIATAFAVAAL
jgi:hypothetical protein